MKKVVGVKFKGTGKVYYFDPHKFDIKVGDDVIVETARGLEYGSTVSITDIEVSKFNREIKKVIRIASLDDLLTKRENNIKEESALEVCREKANELKLDMKPLYVEYTFDSSKIIFFFTADDRVDFRELVKYLAYVYKTRIELRQVGVRDEAKRLGGIGCCGRELCCSSWMSDFQPVSIKMAKTQSLSLNPTKISGRCGRLMCCLKYEQEHYEKTQKKLPKIASLIMHENEEFQVKDINVIREQIQVCKKAEHDGGAPEFIWIDYETYYKENIKEKEGKLKSKKSKKRRKRRKRAKKDARDN